MTEHEKANLTALFAGFTVSTDRTGTASIKLPAGYQIHNGLLIVCVEREPGCPIYEMVAPLFPPANMGLFAEFLHAVRIQGIREVLRP